MAVTPIVPAVSVAAVCFSTPHVLWRHRQLLYSRLVDWSVGVFLRLNAGETLEPTAGPWLATASVIDERMT
ncbi:MAG: hypothetical protein WCO90_02810 [Planctomycetota bacterium]